jgi:hypothetical protein
VEASRLEVQGVLYECPQEFGNTPRLRDASAWTVGPIAVENLGNLSQATFA